MPKPPQDSFSPGLSAGAPNYLVGIGTSAGGLEALTDVFDHMPPDCAERFAFVIIQHLSPDFRSLMPELLTKHTAMPVQSVRNSVEVSPGFVYLLPPKMDMLAKGDRLVTTTRSPANRHDMMPIDSFFASLAQQWGNRAFAIVLSGGGGDGSTGIRRVSELGGTVIVQNPETARFVSMPESALRTGTASAVLAPQQIGQYLVEQIADGEAPAASEISSTLSTLSARTSSATDCPDNSQLNEALDREVFAELLTELGNSYQVDFSRYIRDGIERRFLRYWQATAHKDLSLAQYRAILQSDRVEQQKLLEQLLLGVTSFYRDPDVFQRLGRVIEQTLKKRVTATAPLRIWVSACSSGEEAYSIAIEILEAYRRLGQTPNFRVIATDINPDSIRTAGIGKYSGQAISELPAERIHRYFTKLEDSYYQVSPHLRAHIIFSHHNLLLDPPFTKMDLVTCRNLLMYFKRETRISCLAALHFSIKVKGCLLLGRQEDPGPLSNDFDTKDSTPGLFRKIANSDAARELRKHDQFRNPQPLANRQQSTPTPALVPDGLNRRVISHLVHCGFLVNHKLELVETYGTGAALLRTRSGRVESNLVRLLDPAFAPVVQATVAQARQENTDVEQPCRSPFGGKEDKVYRLQVRVVAQPGCADPHFLIEVAAATDTGASATGTSTGLPEHLSQEHSDATAAHVAALELRLRQARQDLDETVKLLAIANQELQAANEVMVSGNEELQSANEELHSVNEELFSVNAEHERKIQELNEVSGDLNNLIQSTSIATIFLGLDLTVRLFTPEVVNFFNLRNDDIGRDIRDFNPRHGDHSLEDDLQLVIDKNQTVEKKITGPRDTHYIRRASTYRNTAGNVAGITLSYLDVTDISRINQSLAESEHRLKSIYNDSPAAIWVVDFSGAAEALHSLAKETRDLVLYLQSNQEVANRLQHLVTVTDVNNRALELLGCDSVPKAIDHLQTALREGSMRSMLFCAMAELAVGSTHFRDESVLDTPNAETDHVLVSWALPKRESAEQLAYVSAIDFRDRKRAEEALRASELRQRTLIDAVDRSGVGMRVVDDRGNVRYRNRLIDALLGPGAEAGIETLVDESTGQEIRKKTRSVLHSPRGTVEQLRVDMSDQRTLDMVAVPYRDVDGSPCRLEMIRDITEAQRALESQRIAATTFETQQALLLLDPGGKIIRANSSFSTLTGYPIDNLLGKDISELHNPVWLNAYDKDAACRSAMRYWQGEINCQRRDRSTFPAWCIASAVLDEYREPTHYVVSYTNIAEQKHAEAKILQLAFYDQLTKLPNRRMLLDRLSQRMSASDRNGSFGALIFLDLDNFKTLNDTHGHDAGDLLLVQVAERLTGALRESDTVARFGGDEFVVLLDDLGNDERMAAVAAEKVAETLRDAWQKPFDSPKLKNAGGASFGVTLFHGTDLPVETLLKQADLALYQAKQEGKNGIRFFNPQMQAAIDRKIRLQQNLRHAMSNGHLILMYQPQFNRGRQLVGAEALIRWRHPERGLIEPRDFVQEAEESGMIVPIGNWVLQTACYQLAQWSRHEATRHLSLSVNISPRQFRQTDFVSSVRQLLGETGANPNQLKLEITESLLLEDMTNAIKNMEALREVGIRFAIDDFGTGYSSLSYLKQLPVDHLKIDQSFVRDVSANAESAAIVRAIVAMGHTLNLQVTAEGVETSDQASFLEREGCDLFQGFYFGRPVASTSSLINQPLAMSH